MDAAARRQNKERTLGLVRKALVRAAETRAHRRPYHLIFDFLARAVREDNGQEREELDPTLIFCTVVMFAAGYWASRG
jgi:hypothetical protein